MVANTITNAQIAAGTITATELGTSAVTGVKLNSNVVGVNMVYNSASNRLDCIRRVFDPVKCVAASNINPNAVFVSGVTLDGVTLATGDRVLAAGQTAAAGNGIYTVVASAPAVRATDMASGRSDQLSVHSTVFVTSGTASANTTWRVSSTSGAAPSAIVVGTDTSVWMRVEAPVLAASVTPGTFTAGTYSLAGSTITNLGSVTTADINGGTIDNTTIATSNITVGSGKTLDVSAATAFTTSATQNKNIIEGASSNVTFGAFTVTAAAFTQVSDLRFKRNVRDCGGLAVVDQLRGVEWEWRKDLMSKGVDELADESEEQETEDEEEDEDETYDNTSAGVVAQELQLVLPYAVQTGDNGKLSVNYSALHGFEINALKELAARVRALEAQVEELTKGKNKKDKDVKASSQYNLRPRTSGK